MFPGFFFTYRPVYFAFSSILPGAYYALYLFNFSSAELSAVVRETKVATSSECWEIYLQEKDTISYPGMVNFESNFTFTRLLPNG